MKRKIALLATGCVLAISSVNAQIPVTVTSDVPAIMNQVQTMAQWSQQLADMAQQYQQMQADYTQMLKDYEAVTGSRNLGEIFNNKELANALPAEWKSVYDNVRQGGYASATNEALELYKKNQYFDACQSLTVDAQKKSCQANAVKGAQDKAFASAQFDAAEKRLGQIESLMSEINRTNDPKAIGELQARIGAEQASIANEQNKLQLMKMMSDAEEKMNEQRETEIVQKQWARRGHMDLQPLTFD